MSVGRTPKYTRPLARLPLPDAVAQLNDQDLFDGQELRDRREIVIDDKGNGLWVANTNGIETELQLTGRKVKDYRCDCPSFVQHESCAHVAALLAKVKLLKQARPRAPKRPTAQTVSTTRVLKAVSDAELRTFIQQYARTHPEFAFDLKLNFAQALPIANRFEQVIKNLLKRTTTTYSARQSKRIAEALKRFADQRELWLADKAYLDLFELNTTLAERLVLILDKAERVSVSLPAYVSALLDELHLVVKSNPPPVLLERIESWTDSQLEVGAYFRYGVDGAIYKLIASLDSPAAALEKLAVANETYGISESRLGSEIELYYAEGDTAKAEHLLIRHLDSPRLVFGALAQEVEREHYRRAIKLAAAAYDEAQDAAYQQQLAEFLLGAAQAAKASGPVVRFAPPLVLLEGDFTRVEAALDLLSDAALTEVLEAVQQGINSSTLRSDQREVLQAETLIRLGDFVALEKLIYRTTQQTLMQEFLPRLVNRLAKEDYVLLLETKIREHLSGRFGKGPAEWVSNLLAEVSRRSKSDVTAGLVARLRSEFKQRVALQDALDQALL